LVVLWTVVLLANLRVDERFLLLFFCRCTRRLHDVHVHLEASSGRTHSPRGVDAKVQITKHLAGGRRRKRCGSGAGGERQGFWIHGPSYHWMTTTTTTLYVPIAVLYGKVALFDCVIVSIPNYEIESNQIKNDRADTMNRISRTFSFVSQVFPRERRLSQRELLLLP